jgi:exodeoxyribonuclease V beta subunit
VIAIDAHAADGAPPTTNTAALAAWRPEPGDVAPIEGDPALAGLRRARAGAVTTSYSRIKQAHGGYRPPTEMLDEVAAPADAHADDGDGALPGGQATGIFLHAVLEKLPLPPLIETPDFDAWSARPEVQSLVSGLLRQYNRGAGELRPALHLAHAALTASLPVVGGALPGLARAKTTAREMEFLFPFPAEAGGPQRGYVKGFVDVIFEHEGLSYFADWKTDRLPAWNAAAVAAHVDNNYALQERFYALALVRMLGITDAAAYEARFGGTLYVFVRGLAHSQEAIRSRRPTFDEITDWQRDLAVALEGGDQA